MSEGFDIDCSGFDTYGDHLVEAAQRVARGIQPVVSKGALNVKTEWADAFRGSEYFKGAASAVGYDITARSDYVEAEIGPNKARRKAAALANIAHFGGINGGGGTVADPQTFLDDEAPRFVSALEALIVEALK